jgi:hypothetical protein
MVFGVQLGISFFGTAFSESTLIKLASGFEAVTQVRAHNLPTFAPAIPVDTSMGPPTASAKHASAVKASTVLRRPNHL